VLGKAQPSFSGAIYYHSNKPHGNKTHGQQQRRPTISHLASNIPECCHRPKKTGRCLFSTQPKGLQGPPAQGLATATRKLARSPSNSLSQFLLFRPNEFFQGRGVCFDGHRHICRTTRCCSDRKYYGQDTGGVRHHHLHHHLWHPTFVFRPAPHRRHGPGGNQGRLVNVDSGPCGISRKGPPCINSNGNYLTSLHNKRRPTARALANPITIPFSKR